MSPSCQLNVQVITITELANVRACVCVRTCVCVRACVRVCVCVIYIITSVRVYVGTSILFIDDIFKMFPNPSQKMQRFHFFNIPYVFSGVGF